MKPLAGASLVALICAAQVLVQIGAYFWPALLPSMIELWGITVAGALSKQLLRLSPERLDEFACAFSAGHCR